MARQIRNLSRGLLLLLQNARAEAESLRDLAAFDGSGECYLLAARGFARRRRLLARRIKALTGATPRDLVREARRRTSSATMYRLGL